MSRGRSCRHPHRAPDRSRARTHGTTISQPTWPGVPDRLHPAHGAGAPGQQPFEILEDLVGYVATELNANPRDLDLYARRGLLKGEQLHALARCVHYGRLGRLDQRDFKRQTGAASCLLLILAAIIYWQIRGDRSCFERGGLGCGRSQLRVTVPYQPDRVGQRPPLRRVPAQPQSRAKRKA